MESKVDKFELLKTGIVGKNTAYYCGHNYELFSTNMKTRDPVNQYLLEQYSELGAEELGLMNSAVWRDDPQRLLFTLARYKFVAKMLTGIERVAEVGCGDGFGARIVRQQVHNLLVTDIDPVFIGDFDKLREINWPIEARVHDILQSPIGSNFDAIYSLDVMKHIVLKEEGIYLSHICSSLKSTGIAIIGIPSQESQQYASKESSEGHVNCKSGEELRASLKQYFANVFIFSMNDEVVHTGYTPMAHYLIGLCCGIIRR